VSTRTLRPILSKYLGIEVPADNDNANNESIENADSSMFLH